MIAGVVALKEDDTDAGAIAVLVLEVTALNAAVTVDGLFVTIRFMVGVLV